jgi:hypothetical protein
MNHLQVESSYRHRILSKLALVATLALAGCGGGDETAPPSAQGEAKASVSEGVSSDFRTMMDTRESIAESGFDDPACMNWDTYAAQDVYFWRADIKPLDLLREPDGNGYGVSKSPWWVDPNHIAPGAGYLNLVAISYYEGFFGYDAEVMSLVSGKPLDLRNATVKVRWRAPTLAIGPDSKLVFWFQTRAFDPFYEDQRFVNYALTGHPLVPKSGDETWLETEFTLTSDAGIWTCLGSSDTRTDTYGCAGSVDEALATFEADLGFVILSPDEGSAMSSTGAVEFDAISIDVPFRNRTTHVMTTRYMDTESKVCSR